MYQNIKSCVTQNGVNSDFSSCIIGPSRGKLMTFLFAVFINDLETFLDIHEGPSLQTIDNLFNEYLNILMKTFLCCMLMIHYYSRKHMKECKIY